MRQATSRKFLVKPIAVAIALTLAVGTACAAPTPNQMPGAGRVVAASLGSAGTSQGGVGTGLANLVSGGGIGIDGKVVIRWGGSGAPVDGTNPAGFNLGANATLYFGAISANSAVLNIDASGNPSQIYGNLIATAGPIANVAPLDGCSSCSFAPAVYVANANGIVVGAGGRIVAPTGIGLIGANMDNSISIADFVGNNGWVAPDTPTLGASHITFSTLPSGGGTAGQVDIAGAIYGSQSNNDPAPSILLAGNNIHVLNTGNLFGHRMVFQAGVVATASKAAVAGAADVSVNRLWNVDAAVPEGYGGLGTTAGFLTAAGPAGNGNITNEGSIAQGGGGFAMLAMQGTGTIRSGTAGSTDATVGLFVDHDLFIDSLSNTGGVELYNVVSGHTRPYVWSAVVNRWATNAPGAAGGTPVYANVVVDVLTPSGQLSGLTSFGPVNLYGENIAVASTINHKLVSEGGIHHEGGFLANAHGSIALNADFAGADSVIIKAGQDLTITGNGASNINGSNCCGFSIEAGGVTTLAGDILVWSPTLVAGGIEIHTRDKTVISGNLKTASGNILIANAGQGAATATTISGDVDSAGAATISQGASSQAAPLTISGDVVATKGIYIGSAATDSRLALTGDVLSRTDDVLIQGANGAMSAVGSSGGLYAPQGEVRLVSNGNARIGEVNALAIVADFKGLRNEVNDSWTAGTVSITGAPVATTVFTPGGVVTANTINLRGANFRGTGDHGATYDELEDKPAVQFVTNDLNVTLTGSINAPIKDNTNWVLNSLDVAPLNTAAPVHVTVTANGGGFQAVNLRVLGNGVFDTGFTTTPFINVPVTPGGVPAGSLQGNLGSQLIIQADGSLTIVGAPTGAPAGPAAAAQWPGGAAFIAGTTLRLETPFYNAWTETSPPFGGVFFTAPTIALTGYIATSGTAWANFSSKPVTGNPTVYQIRQSAGGSLGFVASDAFAKNDYVNTVAGGVACTQTGPTTWTACP